tara:strand:+ start:273 stop:1397 length:1125 start_codon:yes stop_codon:yes gene_type:complete
MKNSEIIEKLKILGIYSSKQIIEKDLNYWWQLHYQISKNDKEALYLINEALTDLNEIDNVELISVLDGNNIIENHVEEKSISKNNSEVSNEYIDRAMVYIEKGDFDNAVKEADLGINFEENNGELYFIRALARLKSSTIYKNYLMLDDINKAIDLNPTVAYCYRTKAELLFEIVYNRLEHIDSYLPTEDIRKLKEAKKNIDMAIELDEKNGEEEDMDNYILRGRIRIYSGDIEGGRQDILIAKNYFQNLQDKSINEDLSNLLNELVVLSFKKYFEEDAIKIHGKGNISDIQKRNLLIMEKDLNRALALNKDNVYPYFLRGKVRKFLNKNEKSSRDFKIFKAKDPSDSFGLFEQIEEIQNMNNFFWRLNQWLIED